MTMASLDRWALGQVWQLTWQILKSPFDYAVPLWYALFSVLDFSFFTNRSLLVLMDRLLETSSQSTVQTQHIHLLEDAERQKQLLAQLDKKKSELFSLHCISHSAEFHFRTKDFLKAWLEWRWETYLQYWRNPWCRPPVRWQVGVTAQKESFKQVCACMMRVHGCCELLFLCVCSCRCPGIVQNERQSAVHRRWRRGKKYHLYHQFKNIIFFMLCEQSKEIKPVVCTLWWFQMLSPHRCERVPIPKRAVVSRLLSAIFACCRWPITCCQSLVCVSCAKR